MPSFQEVDLGEAEMLETSWIWKNRITQNRPTIVSGDWGAGKSHVLANIISSILNKETFADGEAPGVEPGYILWITTESESGDLARLLDVEGVNAEQRKFVRHLDYLSDGRTLTSFDLDKDLSALTEMVDKYHPFMVIFDPLVEFHSRKEIDTHAIRGLMVKLSSYAKLHKVAIIAVIHWNKDEKQSRKNRMAGSHQYGAGIRTMISVWTDAKDPNIRHFHQEKNSLGPDPSSLLFQIAEPDGLVVWQDEAESSEQSSGGSKLAEAESWLLKHLEDGGKTIDQCVSESGFAIITMKRARHRLGEQLLTKKNIVEGKVVYTWEVVSDKNLWGAEKLSFDPPSRL